MKGNSHLHCRSGTLHFTNSWMSLGTENEMRHVGQCRSRTRLSSLTHALHMAWPQRWLCSHLQLYYLHDIDSALYATTN